MRKYEEIVQLTDEEVKLLNSKIGLKYLLSDKKVDIGKALRLSQYEKELRDLQAEMVKVQEWVINNNKRVVVLFEGRDAAGKGGAIRRLTAHINPRHFRIVALPKPTDEERGSWFFQRYINHLPKPGEMVFFDRSWYNRAVLEPVHGFCTQNEYETFMEHVNDFERMLQESGTYLIKFYYSITKEEQVRRFEEIKSSPLKRWKMSPLDEKAQELWDEYTHYKQEMFARTDTPNSPWVIIPADRKTIARIETVRHILNHLPYK